MGVDIQLKNRCHYTHMCSPSGAVAFADGKILVADDENNKLHMYKSGGGPPTSVFDLEPFLELEDKDEGRFEEVDIEGATWLDGKIFWIGSHSQSKKSKFKPNRHRLFAIEYRNGEIAPFGRPYKRLVADLIHSLVMGDRNVAELLQTASALAPEPDGLNIEGLTSTPDKHLMFGLRGPRMDGKAIVVEIKNPMEIIADSPKAPKFRGYLLDLGNAEKGGNGIRSIEYLPREKSYLIVAGPGGSGGPFDLYSWSGAGGQPRRIGSIDTSQVTSEATPEALIVHPNRKIELLWDEGDRKVNGVLCKDLEKDDDKGFSSFQLTLYGTQTAHF